MNCVWEIGLRCRSPASTCGNAVEKASVGIRELFWRHHIGNFRYTLTIVHLQYYHLKTKKAEAGKG